MQKNQGPLTDRELTAIRLEVEHEEEIERLREEQAWNEPDYRDDGSGQWD